MKDVDIVRFLKAEGFFGIPIDSYNYSSTDTALRGYKSFKVSGGYVLAKQCSAFFRFRFQKKYSKDMFTGE